MCVKCLPQISSTDEFAQRLVGIANDAATALMLSIGYRTGLLDVLARTGPATSEKLAAAAGLNERYVREWLGCMVAARIAMYDAETREHTLPEQYAAVLTRGSDAGNMSSMMQWFAVLGGVEDRVVECFAKGGGVSYEEYGRFHAVMADESQMTTVSALTSAILPLVPGLVDKLRAGIDVLDLGCGSGRALVTMAFAYPNSRFFGYDLSEPALAAGRAFAAEMGVRNAHFEARDVERMNDTARFDLVTAFDAIHDQARPDIVLANIAKALKKDGIFLMQDIKASSAVEKNVENPMGALIYAISCMHCMTVSLARGGMGLGAAWGKELAEKMLADAGFRSTAVHELPHDALNYYYIVRK